MKALNVDQPWATLLIQGRKTIELRKKFTSHRGTLAIRSTKTVLAAHCRRLGLEPGTLASSSILGTVELVGLIEMTPENFNVLRNQHLSGMLTPGDYVWGWRMENPKRLLKPISCDGLPGLFTLPDDIAVQISEFN